MITKKQLAVSLVLLLAAVGVTWSQVGRGGDAPTDAGMEGHDHAAMTAASGSEPVRLDEAAARRIGVSLTTAERKRLHPTVEAVGTVAYDETRLAAVNPKVEGWVETLHVNFTGAPVRRGEALMSVYSPRLVSAQEELALAARLAREATGERAVRNAENLLESARRRLAYWDVPAEEIRRLEETGEVRKTLTLNAPASGIVVEKSVVEGDRIVPGATVFRIADLSTVWIEADVYEKDLGLVLEGQEATVRFEAFPGRAFSARVTYVYPTISVQARTARVRLELPNPDGELKPGMYARITLDAPAVGPTLVVPRSALLDTGRRTLVFVEAPDGSLVPREVSAGRTVGREIEVLSGVEAGERVVSSAAFLVDAESNLGTLREGEATGGREMEMEMETEGGTDGHEGHPPGDAAGPAGREGADAHEGHDAGGR